MDSKQIILGELAGFQLIVIEIINTNRIQASTA